jgi:hypothetical protein
VNKAVGILAGQSRALAESGPECPQAGPGAPCCPRIARLGIWLQCRCRTSLIRIFCGESDERRL